MRVWSRVLVVVAVVLLAAACTGSGSDGDGSTSPSEVRIGLLYAKSGPTKDAGTEALRGAQLAAALVNGEEGAVPLAGTGTAGLARLGGAKLTIVPADTRGDSDQGAEEAARLVGEERVVGLVGAYDSDVTEVASQRSERLRVPFVNGDTSADYLTERGLDWFFRVGPTDRMYGEAFFSTLSQAGGRGARKVAVLASNSRPSSVVAAQIQELADEGGFQLVPGGGKVVFDPAAANGAAVVAQVRDSQPNAVFLVASPPEGAAPGTEAEQMLRTFGQVGYVPPGLFAFGAGVFEPTVLRAVGQDGEGVLYSAAWSREVAGRNPAAKPIMDLYEERFSAPMSEVAAGSFTAVLTLAKAIDDAGSTEPERVRTALLSLDIPGRDTIMPWNGVRFDATHQNTAATGVVEQLVQGAFRTVFPRELAQTNAIWPLGRARGQGAT
jgi:branched-chain amino acid transport system substrate-binding protein